MRNTAWNWVSKISGKGGGLIPDVGELNPEIVTGPAEDPGGIVPAKVPGVCEAGEGSGCRDVPARVLGFLRRLSPPRHLLGDQERPCPRRPGGVLCLAIIGCYSLGMGPSGSAR